MSFADERVLDIVGVMMSSNFFATNSKVTYVRYIRIAKMIFKKEGFLSLHVSLTVDRLVVKTLGTTHHHDPVLYISTEEDILHIT